MAQGTPHTPLCIIWVRLGVPSRRRDRVMAKYIEDLSQFLQSFGVAALALLFLPVLIAALARKVALALTASLLSFTSLMLFIAPASAASGLAIVSGLGSFLVALESIFARRRMMAFDKQLADLTSRVNQLENAEQRRLALEVKRRSQTDRARRRGNQSHQRDGLGIVTKVLYVEHNDDNIYMLKTRLELSGGFEVLAAEDSEKGCRLAATEHPDVILMDLEMPDDDRWEAVRRLKNDPQTQDIPIIGMSAHAVESEREKAIATGCDEFDAKPIEFESLVATIRRVLAPHK
jgi:CheY-like chemotaxis protein